eukprot:8690061-Ditylum_brightwellii.AAC.1
MACHSLDIAITIVTEQTRSGTVIGVHSSGSTLIFLALLKAAVTLVLTNTSGTFCPWVCPAGFTRLQTGTELHKFSQALFHWVNSLYGKLSMPQRWYSVFQDVQNFVIIKWLYAVSVMCGEILEVPIQLGNSGYPFLHGHSSNKPQISPHATLLGLPGFLGEHML